MIKVGDTVRLRSGSPLLALLEPWEDTTGRVTAVFPDLDPPRINVLYGKDGPLASTVIASEFVPDVAIEDAPF